MTTHTLNNHNLLVIDVPEGAYDIRVVGATLEGYKKTGGIYWDRDLPHDRYQLIQTEEDAKGVVEMDWLEEYGATVFYDYEFYGFGEPKFTAIESLNSWIKSINRDPNRVVVFKKIK